jgi:hypothetical protein
MTLERCPDVKRRMENNLGSLDLLQESKKILDIVFHSLQNLWMDIKIWGQPPTILAF